MKEVTKADVSLFALWYAQAKMWKTSTLLCAPPELRPMAVFDTDGNAALRLNVLSMTPEERKKLGVEDNPLYEHAGPWVAKDVRIFQPEYNEETGEGYYEECFKFAKEIAPDFMLAGLDTASRMADNILNQVAHTQYKAQKSRIELGKGDYRTIHPTQSDYGMAQDRVMKIIKMLDDGPQHSVIITHERTGQVTEGDPPVVKRVIGGPRTIGVAQLEVLPSIVDVVLRFEVRSGRGPDGKIRNRFVVRSQNHAPFLAGDRSGLFADGVELDPFEMWSKFVALIEMSGGKVNKGGDAKKETK